MCVKKGYIDASAYKHMAHHAASPAVTHCCNPRCIYVCDIICMQHYMSRLQQLLQLLHASGSSSVMSQPPTAVAAGSPAAAAMQEVSQLVLRWREMTDRHALFSHYHWAIWCLNRSDMESAQLTPPPAETWKAVLQQLSLRCGR
eukprot:GHRR01036811.1.p1 GENE.GHRR01036811.1~~GHRR01036811.1.p1  ORF type:complete len:144 (+),score=56.68 GHRR01036811.1:264-695(+)